ncbi:MAG: hypothetical protein Q7U74_14305, partial [Saprospiraceae bacterium]|nr:hypothetical protein [Saprospiraceae bacterium]
FKTEYEYDPRDHLTKLKEYKAPQDSPAVYDSTLYAYNLHDRLSSQTNALGQTTYYTYCMDRLVKTTYPNDAYDSLGYWDNGSLKFKYDRKKMVTGYEYDGYSGGCLCASRYRLTKKKYYTTWYNYSINNPHDSVAYEYDKVGNRTKMLDSLGATVYSYDGLYRLQSDSCGYLNTKNRYQYDMAGNRTRLKVYQGDDTTTCYLDQTYDNYDAANRVGRTIASGDTFDLNYWDTGTPKEVQYPNGAKEVYGLNLRGQLDSIATTLGDTLTWFKHKYGYNGLGDREWQYIYQTRPEVSTLSDTFKYSYDGLRRLTTAIYPPSTNSGDTVTYVYDAMGNRLEKQSVVNGTTSYTIDNATNRMTQIGGYYFNYDSCGNWTRKWHGDTPVTDIILSYDYENRLTDARGPGYNPY